MGITPTCPGRMMVPGNGTQRHPPPLAHVRPVLSRGRLAVSWARAFRKWERHHPSALRELLLTPFQEISIPRALTWVCGFLDMSSQMEGASQSFKM